MTVSSKFMYLILAPVILALTAGCTKPTKGPDDETALFQVHSIEGVTYNHNLAKETKWQIYESLTATIRACITGTAAHEKLYDQNFTVEVPGERTVYPVQTDNHAGCFTWTETFPYNYFALRSGWVEQERDVVGTGSYQGKRRIRFAINPWSLGNGSRGDVMPLISLEKGESHFPLGSDLLISLKDARRAFSGELGGNASLYIDNVKINSIPESEGSAVHQVKTYVNGKVHLVDETSDWVTLRIVVEMDPKFTAKSAIGETIYKPISDGEFNIRVQAMSVNVGSGMDKQINLLSRADFKDGVSPGNGPYIVRGIARNGTIRAEMLFRQKKRANQSNLELALQVTPADLNAYKMLPAFNGVYRFGPGTVIKDLKGSIKNQCEEDPKACEFNTVISHATNYKDFINDSDVSTNNKNVPEGVVNNSRYVFSMLKLRFIQILPGETTTRRTVLYEAQTCITDNQTGRPLANTPLVIQNLPPGPKAQGQSDQDYKSDLDAFAAEPKYIARSTDETGCLSWNGHQFHKYYEPERYYEKHVRILKGVTPIYDNTNKKLVTGFAGAATMERKLGFYLNPWDDKFTFGWDEREFTQDFFDDIKKRKKIKSRFFLSDYGYHTVRFLYNIDQFMELDVQKWVLMGIVPQVLRYSGIINARKMVERLRDGIYLMKVAIQKSYLDPRDNSGTILKNNKNLQAELMRVDGAELAEREYITTNQVLVRVVDGVIIYPVELTMRDLRLMRVRSNMMIQLEMVDERLIQAYHVFKQFGVEKQKIKESLEEFQKKMPANLTVEDMNRELNGRDKDIDPALKTAIEKRRTLAQSGDMLKARKDLEGRVENAQAAVGDLLARLKKRYDAGAEGLYFEVGADGKPLRLQLPKGALPNSNIELSQSIIDGLNAKLNEVLGVNDFSTVSLPKKEDVDLNIFAEKNSGLEKRSFVGPVIFLSNAYSDSMRATDNLDEAGCPPRDPEGNPLNDPIRNTLNELNLDSDNEVVKRQDEIETKLMNNRQNNAYQYNKYFNSLSHLCYKNVDDMIEAEKTLNRQAEIRARAASLKYNFIKNFNLDFVSLTDEPLHKLNDDCIKKVYVDEKGKEKVDDDEEVAKKIDKCLETTNEDTVSASQLKDLISTRLKDAVSLTNSNPQNFMKTIRRIPYHVEKSEWSESEYQQLFFEHTLESKPALCNLTANHVARQLREQKMTSLSEEKLHAKILYHCIRDGGLIHDIKLRVEKTGKYAFLGGLNLNVNVGEGFSMGTSNGWSAGMELTDLVGVGGAVGAGMLKGASIALKPANLKYGTGLNTSSGTSVSESTYLVSQIAGFDVTLDAYEQCAWVGLSDQAVQSLQDIFGDNSLSRALGLSSSNFSEPNVQKVFHRGLFVCEGKTRTQNKPREVKEKYFYFTQHFTEGDMLDQADLYNHPWLFSLRGMRDFATFVEKIRAQQVVSFGEFLYHLTGTNDTRPKGWALEHLGDAYRNVTPTFPGFYTVLDQCEPNIDVFALQQAERTSVEKIGCDGGETALKKYDTDPLKEVIHPQVNASSRITTGPFR